MTKKLERTEARRLRSEDGESVRWIADRLGVAPSTVSQWVRDIELTSDQIASLQRRNPIVNQQMRGQATIRERARRQRTEWQEDGRRRAREGDPLHRTGCMLHWAEGTKNRNNVIFVNSDVAMMQVYCRFLRDCYGATDQDLRFSVNCFLGNGLDLAEIETSWLDALALPQTALRAATVNRASSASARKGRILLHGTGRLVLHCTEVAQSIYGAIQEYGGFDRPDWLD